MRRCAYASDAYSRGPAVEVVQGLQVPATSLPLEHREMLDLTEPHQEAPSEPDRARTPQPERVLLVAVLGGVFSFRYATFLTSKRRSDTAR